MNDTMIVDKYIIEIHTPVGAEYIENMRNMVTAVIDKTVTTLNQDFQRYQLQVSWMHS